MIDIRDSIRWAIVQSGMKQVVVAERSGLTEQALCDIIKKRRKLDANEMIRFCEVVRVTPNDLYDMAQHVS